MRQQRMTFSRYGEVERAYEGVVNVVGGRLSYLNSIARSPDMLQRARRLLHTEKSWLLSQIGLIPEHDGDVLETVCVFIARNIVRINVYISRNGAWPDGYYSKSLFNNDKSRN